MMLFSLIASTNLFRIGAENLTAREGARQKARQHRGAAALAIEKKSLVGYLSAGTRTHTLHVGKHRLCHRTGSLPSCILRARRRSARSPAQISKSSRYANVARIGSGIRIATSLHSKEIREQ